MESAASSSCIFCRIVAGRAPDRILYEDENHLAFFPIEHINPGHVLLIPKVHVDYLFDLDDPGYVALWRTAARLAPALRSVTSAARIGVAVEGFGVPHAHVHLVPLHARDELEPSRAKPLPPEEASRLATRIKDAFDALGGTSR
jgi:histidine triad (HIT) family protein